MVACLVGANGLHNLAGNDLDRIIHQYVVNSDCRFFVQINKVSRHGVAPPVCWNGIPKSKRLKRTKNQLPALDELVHCRFGIRGECVEGVYELTAIDIVLGTDAVEVAANDHRSRQTRHEPGKIFLSSIATCYQAGALAQQAVDRQTLPRDGRSGRSG